jgi:hypothetical protein
LYREFISAFESKLSQLKLIQIVVVASNQFYPTRPYVDAEVDAALSFISSFTEKKARLGEEAYLVCQMEIARLKLLRGDTNEVKVVKLLFKLSFNSVLSRTSWKSTKRFWTLSTGLSRLHMPVITLLPQNFTRSVYFILVLCLTLPYCSTKGLPVRSTAMVCS